MRAQGYWTWWNHYGTESIEACVRRVKDAGLAGVIVKYGYPAAREAFIQAGIPWATERYTYPTQPDLEAEYLAEDIVHGAQFAVINAEVEWENAPAISMIRLIQHFRVLQPHAELYASVDTRGNRTNLPYQQVLGQNVAGWMPMIYPLAFYPHRPAGYVSQSFQDCLDGKNFQSKPVLPTIQTYGNIGALAVEQEMHEVAQRGLAGCQAYTVDHATGAEWQAFSDGIPEEDEMTEEQLQRLKEAEDAVKRLDKQLADANTHIYDQAVKLTLYERDTNATIWDQAVKQHQLKESHEALQGTVWDQAVKVAKLHPEGAPPDES